MSTLLRRGAITVSALALMLGTVTPAMADTYRHRDARHDVGRARAGSEYSHARANRKFDVTHLQVIHGSRRIQFKVSLRSASLEGLGWRRLAFKMKTNAHAYAGEWKATKHGGPQVDIWDETANREVGCAMSGRTKDNTIWWTINRSCFHHPLWIRVAFSVGGRAGGWAYQDNAQSPSWRHPRDDVYSPRLRASR